MFHFLCMVSAFVFISCDILLAGNCFRVNCLLLTGCLLVITV